MHSTTELETTKVQNIPEIKDGIYYSSAYSLKIPDGWSLIYSDLLIEMHPPNSKSAVIMTQAGQNCGNFDNIKYEDIKKDFGKKWRNIKKEFYGKCVLGSNEYLITKISYTFFNECKYLTYAILHVGDLDITFTFLRNEDFDGDDQFKEILESVNLNSQK